MSRTPEPDPTNVDMRPQDTPQRIDSVETEIKVEDTTTPEIDMTDTSSTPTASQAHDGETIGLDEITSADDLQSMLQSYATTSFDDFLTTDNTLIGNATGHNARNGDPGIEDHEVADAPEPETSGAMGTAAAHSASHLSAPIVPGVSGVDTAANTELSAVQNDRGATPRGSHTQNSSSVGIQGASTVSTEMARASEMLLPGRLDLGSSMLTRKKSSAQRNMPKTGPALSDQERLLAKQQRMREKFLAKMKAEKEQVARLLDDSSDAFSSSGMEVDPPAPAEVFDFEAEAFRKTKDDFHRKERAGTIMPHERIEFYQKEAAENARLAKLEADAAFGSDSDIEDVDSTDASALFVTASPAPKKSGRKRKSKDNVDDAEDGASTPRIAPAKKRSKATGPRKDYPNGDVDEVLTKVRGKQQRGKAAKAKTDKVKGGHQMTNVASLQGTDVFKDTAIAAGLRPQPTFAVGTTHRRKAMVELMASVPSYDKRIAYGDRKLLEECLTDFDNPRDCTVAADGNGWELKGMKVTLKHYQVLGVAFMRRRERGPAPKGGILADAMGLGKTVQMIANIINGKPQGQKPAKLERGTTLIVASPAIIAQWHDEIFKFAKFKKGEGESKCKLHGLDSVVQHTAQHKIPGSDKEIIKIIKRADICLTTWNELCKSYPKAAYPPELTSDRQKTEWWRGFFEAEKGLFHRIKFHRIVLDEAQSIKNHESHNSLACRALDATHYWAITGTPLMNSIKEMYPYLRFIKYPNTGNFEVFKKNFCSPDDPTGGEKLGVLSHQFVIRRTHADKMFNARLLDLPTPQQRTIFLELNEVQKGIYSTLEERFKQRIKTVTKREGARSQHSHIWSKALRLRQICSHPLLIQDTLMDLLEREDFERLNKLIEESSDDSEENVALVAQLRYVLQEHARSRFQAAESELGKARLEDLDVNLPGSSESKSRDVETDLGGSHGRNYNYQKLMKLWKSSRQWEQVEERKRCASCRQPPAVPMITSCFHIYCWECVESLQHIAAQRGHDQARCTKCGICFQGVEALEDPKTTAEQAEGDAETPKSKAKKKKAEAPEFDWINQAGEVLPSAKTIAAKAQILEWLSQEPHSRIIVYTQFLPMIHIMARVCQGEGWTYCEYTGKMSQPAREQALNRFSDPDQGRQILLASLKCGGLGLNITAASRVIIMDPWWNDATEQQAFCRVFRIGQEKDTQLVRFCIKDTIEERMFAIKEGKIEEIDEVINRVSDQKTPTVADMIRLFGVEGAEQNGKAFIFPQEDDETGGDLPPFVGR